MMQQQQQQQQQPQQPQPQVEEQLQQQQQNGKQHKEQALQFTPTKSSTPRRNSSIERSRKYTGESMALVSRGLQQQADRVVVNEGVQVQVQRNEGEGCCRVIHVDGFPFEGALRPGIFLVGAALGSAKVSFVDMPQTAVIAELNKLRSMRKAYTLLVSEICPIQQQQQLLEHTLVLEQDEEKYQPVDARTPRNRYFGSAPGPAYRMRSTFNPQEQTPQVPRFEIESVTSNYGRAYSTSKNRPNVQRSTDVMASPSRESLQGVMDHWSDMNRFQASLERLKMQRATLERLKADLTRKDTRVSALEKENEKLRKDLRVTQETVDEQAKFVAQLEIAKEKIKILESKLSQRDAALVAAKSGASATEEFLRASLEQEKAAREANRADHCKAQELLREQTAQAKARAQGLEHQVGQLKGELQEYHNRLAHSQTELTESHSRQVERLDAVQRALSRAQEERENAIRELRDAQVENEKSSVIIKSLRETVSVAEQRSLSLESKISELDLTILATKKQFMAVEKTDTAKLTELKDKIKHLERELVRKTNELAQSDRKLEEVRNQLESEKKDHKDIRGVLLRKEKELMNQLQAFHRLQALYETAEARLGEASSNLEQAHVELLNERGHNARLEQSLEAERRKCAEWASARLELLDQFCDEEARLRKAL
mmetsp:Transcript_19440/g.34665  ORF Transcript_19440/g.34665 Transcript_19440/m.34665 type:complete len:659 (+) Transcript_19440:325-2301(+)|eukprot:CAMPEP_0184524790 /NCGR_PEP_ID=MMETSP0198_2-20121128/9725_1 /TAXON_ID=1112570 /ORGANISM="Thraustochytrium sp., Strain LLF1b" /LENGTH=658 /DNA_ID=CAMNT_0026916151 /DNA_START=313 /DNA_END=2289 /DNA_ORIENTATION=+